MNIQPAVADGQVMTAAVLREFGSPLVVETVARPIPGPGQVLVEVHASGVNPLDLKIKAGAAAHAQVSTPAILGLDVAGVIVALGEHVTGFGVGDEVYGMVGGVGELPGSLAQYVVADVELIAAKPAQLTMVQAAALPLSVITAWEGLVDRAGVGPGDVVLVQGGAGGVGHIAVQLAKAFGAQVFATASGSGLDVVRDLGAEPIDYRSTSVDQYVGTATAGTGFDIVFDTVGGAVLDESFVAVRRYTGRVVSILGWGTHSLAPLSFRGATYSGVFTLQPLLVGEARGHHGRVLARAAELADAGSLTPRVHSTVFDFSSIGAAYAVLDNGTANGKVIIDVPRS